MSKTLKKSEIYNIVREKQLDLHSEYVMSATLEESHNQSIIEEFKENFIRQNISEKHYYTRFLFMTNNFNSKKLPFSHCKAFEINETEPQAKRILKIFNPLDEYDMNFALLLLDLEKNDVLDSQIIDIITYSLIPSFFKMFLENYAFKLFCNFIEIIQNESLGTKPNYPLHFLFSRSIFASPIFVRFIRKVMHDILQPIYGVDSASISVNQLQNSLFNSFKTNINSIPSYIQNFLNVMDDNFNYLKECFFTQLIQNPELYLVVDLTVFSQFKMSQFKKILASVFDDTFIHSVSDLIKKNKTSENAIFRPENFEVEATQLQNNVMIIDCIDCKLIDIISSHVKIKKNEDEEEEILIEFDQIKEELKNNAILANLVDKKYTLYRSMFQNVKTETFSPFLINTRFQADDSWMNFRYVLKNSPPLPSNVHFQDDKIIGVNDFIELFEYFLVDCCDPKTIITARISFDIFVQELSTDDLKRDYFEKKIQDLVKNHDEQDNVMKIISKFKKEFLYITKIINESIDLNKNLFLVHLMDCYDIDNDDKNLPSIPKRSIQLVQDPNKYVKEYEKYYAIQSRKCLSLFGDPCIFVLRSHFYQSLDFYSYLSLRPDLHKFDEMASIACQKSLAENYSQEYVQKMFKKIKNLEFFTDLFNQLKRAFEINGDLVTKGKIISNSMREIIVLCSSFTEEVGPDYMTPLIVYSLSAANPPNIISNFVFLYEYIYYNNTHLLGNIDQFEQWLMCLNSQILDKYRMFRNNPLSKLARTRTKKIEVIITGNDIRLIVDAVAQVRSILNGNPKTERDVNLILNSVKKFPEGNIICINEGTTTLNTLCIPNFLDVDINFKADLFDFGNVKNKDYDYRMAVFCYKPGKLTALFANNSVPKDVIKFLNSTSECAFNKTFVVGEVGDKLESQLPKGLFIHIDSVFNEVFNELKDQLYLH